MVQKHFWSCGKHVHCHQPTQLKATSPRHSPPGRTALRSNSFFSPNFAPPVPLLLAYRKRLSPKARPAPQPGAEPPSSLTARVGKGQVTPPFTLLCCQGLHTRGALVLPTTHQGWVREGTEPGSAQDGTRGSFPRGEALLLHLDATSAGGGRSSLHSRFWEYAHTWKKPEDFPPFVIWKQQYPRLFQPSRATPDLFTQPMWQALKSKIPPRPLPLPKGEFPQAAPHTCGVTSPAFTDKAKSNR